MNNKCDLQYAEKLKELGVKQTSEFYWVTNFGQIMLTKNDGENCSDYKDAISAFTVGELGEMLPKEITHEICKHESEKYHLYFYRANNPDAWTLQWETLNKIHPTAPTIEDISEANARAKMHIYLIENKLVNVNYEK